MKTILYLYCLLLSVNGFAQNKSRVTISINEDWHFTKQEYSLTDSSKNRELEWDRVTIPHTWNAQDVMDDKPGYYRNDCWYRKNLWIDPSLKGKEVFLFFEGVNQECEVYVNGRTAGSHIGGYNGFYIPVASLLKFGDGSNELVVRVTNTHNKDIAPLSADFTFYGGIYRDVYLVATNKVHFNFTKQGSRGVYITTPLVNRQRASVKISGSIRSEISSSSKVRIQSVVLDRAGKMVAQTIVSNTIRPGADNDFSQTIAEVLQPHLWSPDSPYLYTVQTTIADAASGSVLDELTCSFGFRWFNFDPQKGFFLNDKPLKLVGTSRHQDYKGLGNAVPDELAVRDVVLLKEMGGNFLRVAHYPQDPAVLEACDRIGILASVEIPVVNEITESAAFFQNCLAMQREMIHQNFNHPSVIIWCYMNEVLLRMPFSNDKERQRKYLEQVTLLARKLDSLTRAEDPSRYTMLVNHGDFNRYRAAQLTDIPMLVGWNLYSGWYGGNLQNFAAFLDQHHKELPNKPLLVTEYGADADPRIRSLEPVRFDKSVEYTTQFHQYYFDQMMKRPFVAAAMIWNLADFNSETREETMPHINNKGLLTWDRIAKDPYYYYQSQLLKHPFLKILGSDWELHAGISDSVMPHCLREVQVATNLNELELFANGKSYGKSVPESGICAWKVPFAEGTNTLEVIGSGEGKRLTDRTNRRFQLIPYQLNDEVTRFSELNVLLGANRFLKDEERGIIWIPAQPYREGGWGWIGGKAFKQPNNNRLPYGTDKNVIDTESDPVYQTQQEGIKTFRFDVPAGDYELVMHFAELMGATAKGIPYNLSLGPDPSKATVNRTFNISINDTRVLTTFNIAAQYGISKAVSKKFQVHVTGSQGIQVDFQAITGEPVLNAVQLRKLN